MPVQKCQKDNKPGYRWGEQGACYTYTPGDKASMLRAHEQAIKQGKAEHVHGEKDKEDCPKT